MLLASAGKSLYSGEGDSTNCTFINQLWARLFQRINKIFFVGPAAYPATAKEVTSPFAWSDEQNVNKYLISIFFMLLPAMVDLYFIGSIHVFIYQLLLVFVAIVCRRNT